MIDIVSDEAFERIRLILHEVPGGVEKALKGVITRATATARKTALEGITSVYDIKAGDVRDRKNTTINLRTRKVGGGIVGEVMYAGTKIPLYRFGVTPKNPTPLVYRVPVKIDDSWVMMHPGGAFSARRRKDRPYTRFTHAFVATMSRSSGHTGIFERVNSSPPKIKEMMGASTAEMAGGAGVLAKVDAAVAETVAKRTEHEISRILHGYGG